ncbi:hypothetical protein D3C86_1830290 [compost metagenome]
MNYLDDRTATENPIESFKTLWQSINGMDSWDTNPWVWVVEYERLSVSGFDGVSTEIKRRIDEN